MATTISRQPVRNADLERRPLCEVLGCDETAAYLCECGENGLPQLCETHADSLACAENAGDWILTNCVY